MEKLGQTAHDRFSSSNYAISRKLYFATTTWRREGNELNAQLQWRFQPISGNYNYQIFTSRYREWNTLLSLTNSVSNLLRVNAKANEHRDCTVCTVDVPCRRIRFVITTDRLFVICKTENQQPFALTLRLFDLLIIYSRATFTRIDGQSSSCPGCLSLDPPLIISFVLGPAAKFNWPVNSIKTRSPRILRTKQRRFTRPQYKLAPFIPV